MPYASEGQISQDYSEGAVEITEAQYLEALNGMQEGLHVTIVNGFAVVASPTAPVDEEPEILPEIREAVWRAAEIAVIEDQLMAIEELEGGSTEADPLPGTRTQWLQYRTKVRNWKENATGFPDQALSPVRPT